MTSDLSIKWKVRLAMLAFLGLLLGLVTSSSNFGPFSDFSSDGCFDSGSRLCFRGWPWRVVVVRF